MQDPFYDGTDSVRKSSLVVTPTGFLSVTFLFLSFQKICDKIMKINWLNEFDCLYYNIGEQAPPSKERLKMIYKVILFFA